MRKKKHNLGYYSLDYQERFFRTLMCFPIMVILVLFAYAVLKNKEATLIIAILLTLVWIMQLFYNYFKWKKCKK